MFIKFKSLNLIRLLLFFICVLVWSSKIENAYCKCNIKFPPVVAGVYCNKMITGKWQHQKVRGKE